MGVGASRFLSRKGRLDPIGPTRELTEGFLGGMDTFTASLRDGMRQTLAGIEAAAEA